MEKKEFETKGKGVVGERTKTTPTFIPSVDIYENDETVVLIADMPGATKDGVNIDIEDNELRIIGDVKDQQIGTPIYSEFKVGSFERTFTLSQIIDQSKIEASIKDGVLKLIMTKSDAAKPKKIIVKSE
jgi:HSP20 family protein